jgi:hypothetical protein
MRARRNNCKSIFTTTVYNSSRNIFGTPTLPNAPKVTITSRSSPGDGSITYVLTQAQYDTIKQIHDQYTMQMAQGKYDAIPTNYDQYVTLLNNLDTVNVSDSTLQLLMNIVEKSLIGSMNINALNETVLYDELQILLLNNEIQDILSNKNNKDAISDPDAVRGQLKMEKTFKLSKIYSYYIYLYGMPAFGAGFDYKRLQFLQKSLNMFNAGQMDEPDAKIVETVVDACGNETKIVIPNPEHLPTISIDSYDVSSALYVLMDVRLFNTKLGITKDSSNIDILTSISDYYDLSNSMFLTNTIQITSQDYVNNLVEGGTSRVLSIGQLTTFYSDFSTYISMNFDVSLSKFYSSAPIPNNGVFDVEEYIRVSTKTTQLEGSIDVPFVTENLRSLVMNNQFGNRDPLFGTTASDPNDRTNYNAADGFFAGDRFIVQNTGYQFTLQSISDPTTYTGTPPIPYNDLQTQTISGETMTTLISPINHHTSTITRTVQGTLIIELANLS